MPLTAGRSVYTTRPTHCVRGCGHPLAAGDIRNHHYVCSRCRHNRPAPYRGACLAGCGEPGRRWSGYCLRCYGSAWKRDHRRARILERVLGEALPIPWLIQYPDDPRARAYVRKILVALCEGRLAVVDPRAFTAAAVRRWKARTA